MTNLDFRSIAFAASILFGMTTATSAANLYWVVGNLITNSCDIVSRTPFVGPDGPLWFGNGPHKSYDEARLARQGISACPRIN